MTLCSYTLPIEYTLRVWDTFLYETNIVSQILLNLLEMKEKAILEMDHDVSF